jgi:hypothetical protein
LLQQLAPQHMLRYKQVLVLVLVQRVLPAQQELMV